MARITREDFLRMERDIRRQEFIEECAYDGRLCPRRHEDKKKKRDKNRCREQVRWEE
jgi:hypothetical protein